MANIAEQEPILDVAALLDRYFRMDADSPALAFSRAGTYFVQRCYLHSDTAREDCIDQLIEKMDAEGDAQALARALFSAQFGLYSDRQCFIPIPDERLWTLIDHLCEQVNLNDMGSGESALSLYFSTDRYAHPDLVHGLIKRGLSTDMLNDDTVVAKARQHEHPALAAETTAVWRTTAGTIKTRLQIQNEHTKRRSCRKPGFSP